MIMKTSGRQTRYLSGMANQERALNGWKIRRAAILFSRLLVGMDHKAVEFADVEERAHNRDIRT
ncbi:MAG: hypothetical protein CV090_12240 [Nitrospira sp. WS238]|nr:hypothetical protein [Nitrospira sp. WS238]